MPQSPEFEWSDAWVFCAVQWGGDDLSQVIGVGDMLNHAILNLDEINRALARLSTMGLVERVDGRISTSPDATKLFDVLKTKRGGLFKQVDNMLVQLRKYARNRDVVVQSGHIENVTEAEYNEAVRAYVGTAAP